MTNINLLAQEEHGSSKFPFKNGVGMVASVLLLVVLVYLGMIFYQKRLDAQFKVVNQSYVSEHAVLTKGSAGNILDFQNRLTNAEEMVKKDDLSVENFSQLEKTMLAGDYLTSYNYDAEAKSIGLEGVASNLVDVAKQIREFKENEYFNSVQIGNIGLNESGNVDFSISLKIK